VRLFLLSVRIVRRLVSAVMKAGRASVVASMESRIVVRMALGKSVRRGLNAGLIRGKGRSIRTKHMKVNLKSSCQTSFP
jgi:hypothetical protein